MLPRSLSALTLAVCAALLPATAAAQVSRVGDTTTLIAALARGSAVAYDSKNDRYLVVSSQGTGVVHDVPGGHSGAHAHQQSGS